MAAKKIAVIGAWLLQPIGAAMTLTMLAPAAQAQPGDAMVREAEAAVRSLYEANARAERDGKRGPLQGQGADRYFTANIMTWMRSGEIGAHPLYGAQDFDGRIDRIAPDAEQPMFRGMITIHVDFTNFGQPQRATFLLRADTDREGAPLRIFRVEHDGWSYP